MFSLSRESEQDLAHGILESLLEALQLPKEKQAQFVRDVIVSGLLSEE